MNKMQELEDRIMNCWSVVDDMKEYVRADHIEDDRIMNFLIGMAELYQVKFDNLWKTYEAALTEYYEMQKDRYYAEYRAGEEVTDWPEARAWGAPGPKA